MRRATGRRVLNLFAYTGSFTVAAATGGARSTTSVDLSATYLDWAGRNLALNGVCGPEHALVRADCLRWLDEARGQWDVVVLDPPPHSTSKGMRGDFNVQRDHHRLLGRALDFSPRAECCTSRPTTRDSGSSRRACRPASRS